jgi:putative peptidoglycan lipid II flippase
MRIRDLARNSSLVAAGSLATAITGLALRSVLAARFGSSADTDALVLAIQAVDGLTVPIVAVIGAASIPVLAQIAARDASQTRAVIRALICALGALFAVIAGSFVVMAEPAARWLVGRPEPAVIALTAYALTWLSASVVLYGLTGLMIALAQREGDFLTPAVVLPMRSVGAIAGLVAGGTAYGIAGAVGGYLAGSLIQAAVISARLAPRIGWGTVAFRHPAMTDIVRSAVPLLVGALLIQLNQLVTLRFAATLGEGRVTEFNYGSAIAALAAGLVGPSLADASFPHLSAAAAVSDRDDTRAQIATVLQSALVVGGALSVLLFILAPDLVEVLFGLGRFSAASVQRTAIVLRVYSAGLLPLILATIAARFLYAYRDGGRAQVAVAVALVGNVLALRPMQAAVGLAGVALSYVLALALSVVAMLAVLDRRHQALARGPLRAGAIRSVVSSATVCVAVWMAATVAGHQPLARLIAGGVAGGIALTAVTWGRNELGVRDRVLAYLSRRRRD